MRGKYRDEVRPILINNWEGTYFDFNEEKILKIAGKAKELGIELFVLDDGWFGERNDDFTSLGDWYPNLQKLPGGIAGLAKKIEAMGLKFGLWFEPEMTNKKAGCMRNIRTGSYRHREGTFLSEGISLCLISPEKK